ncbi:tautomerase family protein [Chelatococcus asaccharovorans]|uniref:tautomerase family protein n=1 Tax=Chelatococcus asaccharovorans TaxID=28210 RepID=UPI00224C663B|nr:tautomerase family protein [Chelatococcus asaccharovorans]CAH1670939.1 4-oxalocrotonate tautomerase [Chelatococcus asaccharovorans]CAH1677636.1 4-oxalocrotonate tautomerase [Chelatococcus asaccharovorans]
MIITIQMEKGRNVDTKRRAAKAFTDAAIATLGAKAEWVTVLFEDYERTDWAIGGNLQLDRHGPGLVTLGNKD